MNILHVLLFFIFVVQGASAAEYSFENPRKYLETLISDQKKYTQDEKEMAQIIIDDFYKKYFIKDLSILRCAITLIQVIERKNFYRNHNNIEVCNEEYIKTIPFLDVTSFYILEPTPVAATQQKKST